MNDERRDEEIHVTDRRRFHADGEPAVLPADEGEANLPDLAETAAEAPGAAALAEAEAAARVWEERARTAEGRLADLQDSFLRAKEDLAATRARLERDQERRVRDALGRAFSSILEALDGFDRALAHAGDDPLAEGVRLVQKQLLDALAGEGLERIETLGKPFDPNVAEAVLSCPAEDPAARQTVVEEYRAGYRLGERVLRAAQVKVAV